MQLRPLHSTMALLVFLAVAGPVACGDHTPTSPAPVVEELTVRVESASIVFHHAPGDGVDVDLQQAFHEWFTGLIGIEPPTRIRYHKYRSLDHMRALTGRTGTGWADPPLDVHSIYPAHPHEAVHLYTHQLGRPADFFNEGIAVALGVDPRDPGSVPRWNGIHIHTWTQTMLEDGSLRPLAELVETDAFRRLADSEAYPAAGSFVRYLFDRQGVAPLVAFFRDGTREESLATIRRRFRACFGEDLETTESEWRAFLAGWGS